MADTIVSPNSGDMPPQQQPPDDSGGSAIPKPANFVSQVHTIITTAGATPPPYPAPGTDIMNQSPTHQTGGNVITPPPWTPPPHLTPPPITGGRDRGRIQADTQFAVLQPIDDCMRSVTVITPFTPGMIIEILVNGIVRASVTEPHAFDFPIDGCLKLGDSVTARLTVFVPTKTVTVSDAVVVESHTKYSCLTQHYNMARTGWYPYETKLNPNDTTYWQQFSQKMKFPIDGKALAQPLYMHQQYFPGLGAHNALFVVTENDSVYAFDADTGQTLWQRTLLPYGYRAVSTDSASIYGNDLGCADIFPLVGISSTPVIDCCCHNDCGCDESPRPPMMYVTAKSIRKSDGSFHWFLHALDVTSGLEGPSSPVEITGQVPGTGGDITNTDPSLKSGDGTNVFFKPRIQNNRPGLLLLNGTIYIAFASHCDNHGAFGWIISYDTKTLKRKNIFCTTPDAPFVPQKTPLGGIWQSGMGLASDGSAIYCTTGNGVFDADIIATGYGNAPNDFPPYRPSNYYTGSIDFSGMEGDTITIEVDRPTLLGLHTYEQFRILAIDPLGASDNFTVKLSGSPSLDLLPSRFVVGGGGGDFGNSVLKLSGDLTLLSSFTPADIVYLNRGDGDLGCGGVLILPDIQQGDHANLLVTCGKSGDIWTLDRNALGGFAGPSANNPPLTGPTGDNPNVVSMTELQGTAHRLAGDNSPGAWGGPAYFNGPSGQRIFYCGNGDASGQAGIPGPLRAFNVANGILTPADSSIDSFPTMGSIPVVSSNQQANGIVWAVNRQFAGADLNGNPANCVTLRAYDANNVTQALHPTTEWQIGTWKVGRAFVVPTVMNGKVYVACEDHVGVFY